MIIDNDIETYIINNDKYIVESIFGDEELESIIADIITNKPQTVDKQAL